MNPSRRCAKVRVDTLLSFRQLLDYTAFDRICQAVFRIIHINYKLPRRLLYFRMYSE